MIVAPRLPGNCPSPCDVQRTSPPALCAIVCGQGGPHTTGTERHTSPAPSGGLPGVCPWAVPLGSPSSPRAQAGGQAGRRKGLPWDRPDRCASRGWGPDGHPAPPGHPSQLWEMPPWSARILPSEPAQDAPPPRSRVVRQPGWPRLGSRTVSPGAHLALCPWGRPARLCGPLMVVPSPWDCSDKLSRACPASPVTTLPDLPQPGGTCAAYRAPEPGLGGQAAEGWGGRVPGQPLLLRSQPPPARQAPSCPQ